MEDNIAGLFSGIEIEKRSKIMALMQDWRKTVSSSKIVYKDDNKKYTGDEYFASDGFFPGYYGTNPKVLFIAREPREHGGYDYIDGWIHDFKKRKSNDFKGKDSLNKSFFWKRILCIHHIIRNNGVIENITVNEIIESMIEKNDYGFAVMNISKYANASETGRRRDKDLMNRFFEDSKLEQRNFFKEELEILDPDIIITANFLDGKIVREEYIIQCFGKITFFEKETKKLKYAVALNSIDVNNKKVKVIEFPHFSAPGSCLERYYKPLSKLLSKL